MKYTKQQIAKLKEKGLQRFKIHKANDPIITIKDGFFIYESKINEI